MKNILYDIIDHKKSEVKQSKLSRSIAQLEGMPCFKNETISLKKALVDPAKTGIIAEFKRRSPSAGIINHHSKVEAVAESYFTNNASGISILTDKDFFYGEMDDLLEVRKFRMPLLRKDFIIDEYQVIETKAFGADVVLLIAGCLSEKQLIDLTILAKSIGLEVLFEMHNEKELGMICAGIDMVGVNNRDLSNFKVDIQTSFDLVKKIPSSIMAVSESGISEVETIVSLKKAGFNGFLIGENFMKTNDPAIAFADFVKQLKAKE